VFLISCDGIGNTSFLREHLSSDNALETALLSRPFEIVLYAGADTPASFRGNLIT
jgi:hypothetical protein